MKKLITILGLLFPFFLIGQVTFTKVPLNRQLVPRDLVTNLGEVEIEGEINSTLTPYDSIEIEVSREGVLQTTETINLVYSGNIATFSFSHDILAELANYSFDIYGVQGINRTLIQNIFEVVAGDAYIIQGQSNAVAQIRAGSTSANVNQSNFIRVFATGTDDPINLVNNSLWYIGQGDGNYDSNGNLGQWGIKLARLIVDNYNIPVAFFNGARNAEDISYFQAPVDYQTSLQSNYGRLYYRLVESGLKDHVRALFWSQGESDALDNNTVTTYYKNAFLTLKNSWQTDSSSLSKFYIFQTRNGCNRTVANVMKVKEAQRQLAVENADIDIMSTANLTFASDRCHYVYTGGYEVFATRIFELVKRDFYGGSATLEIEPPMITSAYLTNETTLVVETDANALVLNSFPADFELEDSNSTSIINIEIVLNKIIFTLSEKPSVNATISYLAPPQFVVNGNFIDNTNNLELVCFNKFPIDDTIIQSKNILITQYYEGENQDRWIEIKNISGNIINSGDYYLAFYDSDNVFTMSTSLPDFNELIPEMAIDEVLVFKNTNATLPLLANLGSATQLISNVVDFDGDDIVLISTRSDESCFAHRQDIIGSDGWDGSDISLIRGADNELPEENFDMSNWMTLSILDDVNSANPNTNIAIGTQAIGKTEWDGTTWNNLVPDKTRVTELDSYYSANNGNIEAYDLRINSFVTLDFDENTTNSVFVENNLTIFGGFLIGDTESLITMGDASSVTGSVIKYDESTLLNNSFDFTYWSSPIMNADISTIFADADLSRVYHWSEPFDGNYGGWTPATGTMTNAKGYISEAPTGVNRHEVTFIGTPNSGVISKSVGYDSFTGPDGGGFNLIGNPYPTAIDIDKFIEFDDGTLNNSILDGTIWLWTHTTPYEDNPGSLGDYNVDDYATYNLTGGVSSGDPGSGNIVPTNNVGSSQGFFVRTLSTGSVFFTNEMKIKDSNNQFFRSSKTSKNNIEKDRIWLNIKSKQGGAFNQILIGFFDKATNGFDRKYDGYKFNGGNYISLYSLINDKKYAIQGLGKFNSDIKIPIGLDSYIKETFAISIHNVEGVLKNESVYLVDNYLNKIHDLKVCDYEFEIEETGSFADRFTLQFNSSTLNIEDPVLENNLVIVNENSYLRIKTNELTSNVKVYDMLGRLLTEKSPNEYDFLINTQNISVGTVLIVNVILENGQKLSKKIIKL